MTRSILIVGLGGLGAAAAEALVRGGASRLTLVDGDRVAESNLHRQLLYGREDLGQPKAIVARERLAALAPGDLAIEAVPDDLDPSNGEALFASNDFIIDGTDSPLAKFLLNDLAAASGKTLSHAGVVGYTGQLLTIVPGETACLRCVFGEAPEEGSLPTCQDAGVLGPLAGWIGSLQAEEALAFLRGEPLRHAGRWTTIKAVSFRSRAVEARIDPNCPCQTSKARASDLSASA